MLKNQKGFRKTTEKNGQLIGDPNFFEIEFDSFSFSECQQIMMNEVIHVKYRDQLPHVETQKISFIHGIIFYCDQFMLLIADADSQSFIPTNKQQFFKNYIFVPDFQA